MNVSQMENVTLSEATIRLENRPLNYPDWLNLDKLQMACWICMQPTGRHCFQSNIGLCSVGYFYGKRFLFLNKNIGNPLPWRKVPNNVWVRPDSLLFSQPCFLKEQNMW